MNWRPEHGLAACPLRVTRYPLKRFESLRNKESATGVPRMLRYMIRFEILLPLFYNDGRPIEREKFLQTDDELVQAFGATSTDTVVVRGRWVYQSTVYNDQLIRVRLDIE